ncbi:MAG: hypothetical protein WC781_04205 [Candidatus Pacearchaeota archaeon]|jgi:hypothetical protein
MEKETFDDKKVLTTRLGDYLPFLDSDPSEYKPVGIHSEAITYDTCFASFKNHAQDLNAKVVVDFQHIPILNKGYHQHYMHGTAIVPRKWT